MKQINNVVDFGDLCSFAEEKGIAGYNEANDILYEYAYPYPESSTREVELSQMKYVTNDKARDILTKFMEENNTKYITVME